MRKIMIWFCYGLLAYTSTVAQNVSHVEYSNGSPFELGITYRIHSGILREDRILNIYTPDNYSKDSTARFPVVYLLDGSSNEDFIHVCGIVQFLAMIGSMPPTIVIGIGNVDRKRDFTFPTSIKKDKADYPTTGGSENFISFIEKELQPYIKQSYRTNDTTLLIGQSLGGLLATEILFRKPGLFNNYIIVSPSLWWDNESLLKIPTRLQQVNGSDSLHVFLTVGKEGKQMENDAATLAKTIKQYSGTGIKMNFQPLPKENHLTILHQAVYAALVWRFRK